MTTKRTRKYRPRIMSRNLVSYTKELLTKHPIKTVVALTKISYSTVYNISRGYYDFFADIRDEVFKERPDYRYYNRIQPERKYLRVQKRMTKHIFNELFRFKGERMKLYKDYFDGI